MVDDVLTGVLIGGLVGVVIAVYLCGRYWIWLWRFRKEWRAEREQWFREHQQCCELDESYLAQPYG